MCRRQFLSVCRFIIMCNIGAEIHYGRVEATYEPTWTFHCANAFDETNVKVEGNIINFEGKIWEKDISEQTKIKSSESRREFKFKIFF